MIPLRELLVRKLAWCAALALTSVLASAAAGQEVDWRYDYARARQEAVEKGRPLLIDFGTSAFTCVYCIRLDNGPLRDPAIVQLLNERFIPLKIDAHLNRSLTDFLKIRGFPTLVFASAQGRVLGSHEGYLETPALREHLDRVLALTSAAAPPVREQPRPEPQRPEPDPNATVATPGPGPIVETPRPTPVAGAAPAPSPSPATEVAGVPPLPRLASISSQPTESVQPSQVGAVMSQLSRMLRGTFASQQGAQFLVNLTSKGDAPDLIRIRQAQDLLDQARTDYQQQHFLICLDRCEMLMSSYPDLAEAQEARQLAGEIRKNPEWIKLACDQLGDRLSVMYLNLAETWLTKGEPQQAIFYLERVIQTAPNTRYAETAQVRLAQLQGQPGKVTR